MRHLYLGGLALCLGLAVRAAATQTPELRKLAKEIVPQVRIEDDAAFFAAWNLDRPGLEAVQAAVAAGDFAQAKRSLKAYFRQRRTPCWKINHWDMPAKPKGDARKHTQYRLGEEILAHRFSGGGFTVDFAPKIDWNYFPLRLPNGQLDTEYPLTHSLNRFGHFSSVLGPLYWHSLDERYAREFVAEVTDHVLSNPAPEGYIRNTAVWSRLTSCGPLNGTWLDAYNYFLASPSFTPEAHAVMLKGFIEKARYAVRAPDSVNRYMLQLAGIYNVGAYLPELKQAASLRDFAIAGMRISAQEEFYPDCISKELSPGYHGTSRTAIERIITTARLMGYPSPPELERAVKHTYDFYPKVATPLGGLPDFGDTGGPGYGSLPKTFAAVRGRWDDPVFEWFASNGSAGQAPAFTSIRLPWAGFYVMRSGWDRDARYLCLDAGPLGKGHWHEDCGNFECYAYGEHLIAEMGVYSYVYSQWNQYCKSSLAHNVVLVDGHSQRRSRRGPFVVDKPRDQDWHSDGVLDLACSFYDGPWSDFMDSRGQKAVDLPATHRRDMCFVKSDYWILSDRLECPGRHAYAQLFHFRPDRTVAIFGPAQAGTKDSERANIMLVQADASTAAQVIRGREDPPQGWFSPGRGKIEPAAMLSFDQTVEDFAIYDTVLLPLRAGQPVEITVTRQVVADESGERLAPRQVCALAITTAAGTDYYLNDLRQAEIGPANGRIKSLRSTEGQETLETDARTALVRLDREGRVRTASAVGGSFLKYGGAKLQLP